MTSVAELYNYHRYGEQHRRRNRQLQGITLDRHSLLDTALMPVAISTQIPVNPGVYWGCDFAGGYDGTPDMARFKARGGRFAFFKAADGTIKARLIDENIANAQAQELVTGAYNWLYRNERISGSSQAKAWWNVVKSKGLDFHVVDFEWTMWMGRADNPTTSDLWGAIDPFQQLSGKAMWIYSAPGYLAEFFNHSDKFKANPLIIAQYGVIWPAAVAPWGAGGHTIWQCTDRWPGAELGVNPSDSNAEDGDIFNGDGARFYSIFPPKNPPQPIPEPTPAPSITTAVVTAERGLRVHAAADLSSEVVGGLPKDTSVPVEVRGDWAELHGFVASQFLDLAPANEPAPTPEPEPIPTPQPAPGVVNELRYGILRGFGIDNGLTNPPADSGRRPGYTPAVVRINDHPSPGPVGQELKKGASIPITDSERAFVAAINNEQGAHYVNDTIGAMIINSPGKAESISCQANFVSWPTTAQGCAKLSCFQGDEDFGKFDPAHVNWHRRPDLFFKCLAVNLQGDKRIKVANDVDAFAPLMARSKVQGGAGELWLDLKAIEPFPELPIDITIQVPVLNIRKSFGLDAEDIGDYISGDVVTLLEYRPIGASVWARTTDGWICLLLAEHPGQRQFLTSWTLDTPGVIPPG